MPVGGRKTQLTPAVHKAIVKIVSDGNYFTTAAKQVGVDRKVVGRWLQIGRGEHPTIGAKEPFISFAEDVDNALANAEIKLVSDLAQSEDWRAKAWLLERGPNRERWSQNVTINAQLAPAASILDTLRHRAAGEFAEDEYRPQLIEAKVIEVSDAEG